MTDSGNRADVVVIGAGTAGCIVAERLSRAGQSVILLDEGGAVEPSPLALLPLTDGPQVRWYADSDGVPLPRGRGLGGSAQINAGYFLRWHRDDVGSWPWSADVVARAYDMVDGGAAGGGLLAAGPVTDSELSPLAAAFEQAAVDSGLERVDGPWSAVGVNRMRLNRRDGSRWTAWDAVRPFLKAIVHQRVRADRLTRTGGEWFVDTAVGRFSAPSVVLTAGAFGTARILLRSSLVGSELRFVEHREQLVRYRLRSPIRAASSLLHTAIHLDEGIEVRPYNGGFSSYIPGLAPDDAAVGIALMRPAGRGRSTLDGDGELQVELPVLTADDRARVDAGIDTVRRLLASPALDRWVQPGSVSVDEPLGTSQHACSTMPLGQSISAAGEIRGHAGLYVADGSALPAGGAAGPHATIAALASMIAEGLADGPQPL